jgi:hypothetical protein
LWTSLPKPFLSAQRLSEHTVLINKKGTTHYQLKQLTLSFKGLATFFRFKSVHHTKQIEKPVEENVSRVLTDDLYFLTYCGVI